MRTDFIGHYLRLATEIEFWLDVAVFERAVLTIRNVVGKGLEDQQARFLPNALSLYTKKRQAKP